MQPPARSRVIGLDGIRGLAALFVVMNHLYLRSFPGYPRITAPWWAGAFIYGRFPVVVFIVLSGFSLAVSPARHGWRLDSIANFARRRAWRILPPYWAALTFSLLIGWFVINQPGDTTPTAKSVLVNGALVQDLFTAPSPNRAYWTIAIEAQLYLVFPLLLLIIRRWSAVVLVALTAVAATIAAALFTPVSLVDHAPDLGALFAVGVVSAGIVSAGPRVRALPWHWFAVAAAAPVIALIVWKGSVWSLDNLFLTDLAWAPAIGCALAAFAVGRPRPAVALLGTRPLRTLGSFSYSLYLTHAPLVAIVTFDFVNRHFPMGVRSFLVSVAIGIPVTVLFAWGFGSVFEIPFQRYRGWDALTARLRQSFTSRQSIVDPAVPPQPVE